MYLFIYREIYVHFPEMKIIDFCVSKGEECRGKKGSQTEDVMSSSYFSDIPISLQMIVS